MGGAAGGGMAWGDEKQNTVNFANLISGMLILKALRLTYYAQFLAKFEVRHLRTLNVS